MERQLDPQGIDDAHTDQMLAPYRSVLLPPARAREAYLEPVRRLKAPNGKLKLALATRRLIQDAQMVQFVRQVASERQLLEVMVDFWFNHFNVYAQKGQVKVLVTDYIERAIRPHALGRFEDLLIATARHPAMLLYLDNHGSSVVRAGAKKPTDINENYARELLELHTLGVHGGYTQQDVIEVARILTGWTIQDLRKGSFGFAFKPYMHDFKSKLVLGVAYPSDRGEEEGIELLKRLAAHPATARRLATKLCVRFVDDTPPPNCVEQLAKTYTSTRGDIRALLKTLIALPDFWQHTRSKLKSPNLFLVSTYRTLGTVPKSAEECATIARSLGEPKLMQPAPTGYLNDPVAWLSTASLLERMNFALAAADSAIPPAPDALDDAKIVERVNQSLLAGLASDATLVTLRSQIAQEETVRQRLQTATALGLSSPDFQYY